MMKRKDITKIRIKVTCFFMKRHDAEKIFFILNFIFYKRT